MSRFDYLIEKIVQADFEGVPFTHIYIRDFFSPEDFAELTAAPEIRLEPAKDDDDLFSKLFDAGYKIVPFPGCITDKNLYLKWHANKSRHKKMHTACEGFGITVRLFEPKTAAIRELNEFLAGEKFNRAFAEKFGFDLDACNTDNGIQKYLDGYEISPHPDIRRKATTFMVNLNPHENSESYAHHTHYLKMRPAREYVREFWEKNADVERCWVPWDWCETVKMQPENNSIVLFSPSCDTMHGVKASYDHLGAQRTQLYGNLWHKANPELKLHEWEDFDGRVSAAATPSVRTLVKNALPESILNSLRGVRKKLQSTDVGDRVY